MKDVILERQAMISYVDLFGKPSDVDPLALVSKLPLTDALETIAHLLLRLTGVSRKDVEFHRQNLSAWMMRLEENEKILVFKFIRDEEAFNLPGFIFTDRRACLQLMQYILAGAKKDARKMNKKDYGVLLKALLYCNHLELLRQKHVFYWDGNGGTEAYLNKILPLKISSIELDRPKSYHIQLMKAYYFFRFCELDKEYSTLIQAFLKLYDLPDFGQYILRIIEPFLLMVTSEEVTPILQVDDNPTAISFFDSLIINGQVVPINQDYLKLREYPLYKGDEGRYCFMYNNFFIDKLYQGFLFDFVKVLQSAGHSTLNYGKLKQDMGMRFSEKILFYSVMEKCFFKYGNKRINGSALKIQLTSGEPDYYIREGGKIFLFEYKDYTISAELKHAGSADFVKQKLLERLGRSLEQLVNGIKVILTGVYQQLFIDDFSTADIMFYPILVHTDVCLEADGINYLLNKQFVSLLESYDLPMHRIKSLVVVNQDSFMALQDIFRKNSVKLSACINAYFEYIKKGSERNHLFSFDDFLKHYFVLRKHNIIAAPEEFNNINVFSD